MKTKFQEAVEVKLRECRERGCGAVAVHITIKWRMRKEKMRKADEDAGRQKLQLREQVQEPRWTWAQRCEMTPRNWSPRLPHLHTDAGSFLGGAALGLLQDFGPSHTPSVYVLLHYISAQAAFCTEVFLSVNPIQPWRMNSECQLQHLSFCPHSPFLFSVPSQPLASCVILGMSASSLLSQVLSNKREHSGIVAWVYWNNAHEAWRCVCHCKSLKYVSGGGG